MLIFPDFLVGKSGDKKVLIYWVLVAHICNPSYSGGRDQKAAWANSSRDPILKKPFTKKGWGSGSRCRP
jgi:hypothetical protein